MAVVVAVMAICSCDEATIYDSYRHVNVEGWERGDTLVFDMKPVARSGDYAEALGVRLDGNYPFTQLSVVVEQTILPSYTMLRDTVICDITTDNGTPKGHGLNIYQHIVPIGSISLSEGDSLHIVVHHGMRRELLKGISEVGIRIGVKD